MRLVQGWNRWWFGPLSPGPLGITRLVFGVLVIAYIGLLWPERGLWLSERGLLPVAQSDAFNDFGMHIPRIDIIHGVSTAHGLSIFFGVFLLIALLFTIGLWTRLSAVGVWLCLLSLHNRNVPIHNSGDVLMLVMAAYFALSPAGGACSLDRLGRILRGREDVAPPPALPWAQRLMQLQVAAVYLSTSLSKLTGERWRDGTAVYYPLHLPDSVRFPVPWMDAQHLWFIHILTYSAIGVELAMWTLIWVPRLRLSVLLLGVFLHLGIEYSLNIPLFSFIMITCYGIFLTQADWERFTAWANSRLAALRLRVVYDGECDFCKSSVLVLRFLDALRLLSFYDAHDPAQLAQASPVTFEQAERSAWAVDAWDRAYPGFYAFRQMARRLPATWLLVPFLYIPGIPWLGERAYAWVVKHRSALPVAPRYQTKGGRPRVGL